MINFIYGKENSRLSTLIEKIVTRPNIINNNTNIKGNNNNLNSILASYDLYEKQVNPERIKSIDHSLIENHFWLGQKGIARFV